MRKLALTRYAVALFVMGSIAVAGFVLSRPKHAMAQAPAASSPTTPAPDPDPFSLEDVEGRYVSAENAYDVSSVHPFAAPNGSLAGGPIFFATTAVMKADGDGNVCGESDGFYGGFPPPGVNLGPVLFHGTYAVEAGTGRVTILTCSDGPPSAANTFCGTSTPCAPVSKEQVGYVQGHEARVITTVEQTGVGDPDVTGFLVHKRVWTKKNSEED